MPADCQPKAAHHALCRARARAGLVLTGGGARGAYQVGVLKALAEAMPGPTPFPVITGVSVGAINAVVLAEGADDFPKAVQKLEFFWRSLTCNSVFVAGTVPIFGRLGRWGASLGLGWTGVRAPKSLFDATPLQQLISDQVDFERIRAMVRERALCALAVTASSYSTGEAVSFIQAAPGRQGWHRSRRKGKFTDISVDHVMASAALPAIFQSRQIDNQWFGDGALRQTAPLSPAIHLGCDRLLTVSPRDGHIDTPPQTGAGQSHPSLGLLGGQLLDIVFNDNLDADLERLRRVSDTCALIPADHRNKTALRIIHARLVRPSTDLRSLAGAYAHELPWTLKALLRTIGATRPPWVLPSYLNFENGYVSALIDLGYRDTQSRLDELVAFLRA